MAARSVLIVAPPSIVERLRAASPEFDLTESSLDLLEDAVVRVIPTAVVTWDVPTERVLPVIARVRARDRGAHLIVVTSTTDADGRLAVPTRRGRRGPAADRRR